MVAVHTTKRGVKILHFLQPCPQRIFFINSIAADSNKNNGSDNEQRVEKSPKSPKSIEKLETFADHDLGNIQNITPSINMINTPLLY